MHREEVGYPTPILKYDFSEIDIGKISTLPPAGHNDFIINRVIIFRFTMVIGQNLDK